MHPSFHHWSFSIRFFAVAAFLTVINCFLFPWETTLAWMQEGGIVENATVFMYYLALTSVWLFPPRALNRLSVAAISLLLIAAAARELDLHKAMFGMSILKTNFYREYASGTQIAAALTMLLPVFAAVAYLVLRHGRQLVAAAKARHSAAVTVVSMFGFLVLLKIFDSVIGLVGTRLGKPGEIWGYTTPAGLITMALEESLEMALPLLIVVAVAQARKPRTELQ